MVLLSLPPEIFQGGNGALVSPLKNFQVGGNGTLALPQKILRGGTTLPPPQKKILPPPKKITPPSTKSQRGEGLEGEDRL